MSPDETPAEDLPEYDGSEAYGVFGEGRPRRIVGESDEPPRRRPRRRRPDAEGAPPPA
jgi:hypothetical protein